VAPSRCAFLDANRHLLPAALAALCLCVCAIAPSALASPGSGTPRAAAPTSHSSAPAKATTAKHTTAKHTTAKHTRSDRRAHAHSVTCAKRASFHSSGGKRQTTGNSHHAKRGTSCRRRRSKGNSHANARRKAKAKHPTPASHAPASHSSACPDADLQPTAEDLERIRAATLCLVNHERTGQGEVPLQGNGHLQQAAQGHSEDMASGDYFEHTGQNGDTPLQRMRVAGYLPDPNVGYEVGENIAWGTLWLATPRAIVAAWMASPGHRANILDVGFRDTGIGISPHPISSLAHGQAGAIYTQDFGVIIG
jgi:uncharacterized protein YkwD